MRVTRAALPSHIERRGAIVNVSSTTARQPANGPAAYSASKAALTSLGTALSEEFGPQGVRVNTVSPGMVRTSAYDPNGMAGEMAAASNLTFPEFMDSLVTNQKITTGRMSEATEIADLIAFLLSDRAANITGTDYVIDGGGLKTV